MSLMSKNGFDVAQYAVEALHSMYKGIPPMPPPSGWGTEKQQLAAKLIYERLEQLTPEEVDRLIRSFLTILK